MRSSSVGWNGIANDTAKHRPRYFISQDDERGRSYGRSVVWFSAHRLSQLLPLHLPTHVSPYDVMQCNAIYRKPPTHSPPSCKQNPPSSLSLHVLFHQTSREEDFSHLKGKVRVGTSILTSRLRQQYRRMVVSELFLTVPPVGFSKY